jgi:hypothetical protein
MRCEDTPARLAGSLAGTLPDSERRELEEHAQTCRACREELQNGSDMWQRLGALTSERLPDSAAMRRRFDDLVREEMGASPLALPVSTSRARHRPRPWTLAPLLQSAAAALILMAGFQLGRQTAPPTAAPSTDVGELRREVQGLRQMMTLSLLHQQSASERLRGVSWSSQIEGPGNEVVTALIDTLMRDENVNVRLASIDALKRFAERENVRAAAIRALGTQTSPLVQMALIDFVVETRERGALGILQRLSGDSLVNETVRARARAGIQHLEAA